MTILITGAGGQLGGHVVDALLERGTAASEIVAGTRTPEALAALAARGVRVVELDYHRPETIVAALDGVDTVLLVSGVDPERLAGHTNVVSASADAGVTKLVYTSAPNALEESYLLAADHAATERAIAASGVPAVILRNSWYNENYVQDVLNAEGSGVIAAAVGDGLVASANRHDYAEAAAVVLLEDGHIGRTYELSGDESWDYDHLAAVAGRILGREVAYRRLTTDELIAALQGAGLDAGTAAFVADLDAAIGRSVLSGDEGTLSRLIGRPTVPLADGLAAAVTAARA